MPAFDGTGPGGQGPGSGRGHGACLPSDPKWASRAQQQSPTKSFWAGLAGVALQFAAAYWLGGQPGGGGRGPRRGR